VTCAHPHVVIDARHEGWTDGNVRLMHLSIRCADCGQPFTFLGPITVGDSHREPTVNPDRSMVSLPIAPRGEVVRGYVRDRQGMLLR
jgi:hypothetical protein